MDKNQHTFLTFNRWRGELHGGINLDYKGLSADEIQQAIDEYVVNRNELQKENKRLERLLDELLNENLNLKRIKDKYDKWQEQYNSGY